MTREMRIDGWRWFRWHIVKNCEPYWEDRIEHRSYASLLACEIHNRNPHLDRKELHKYCERLWEACL